jgi:hypothetical protein
MHTNAETVVRAAYRAAEGSDLDVQGFMDLFAEDGVFNNVVAGETYRVSTSATWSTSWERSPPTCTADCTGSTSRATPSPSS